MNLSDYIIKYRKDHDLSQREFASKCGLSNGYISLLEKGVNPKTGQPIAPTIDKYKKIAKGTGVSIDELFLIIDDAPLKLYSSYRPSNARSIHKKTLPVIGSIACGSPKFANEELEFYVDNDNDIDADYCLIASGDSMIGARIHDGDIVFIRKQDIVENGDIAAVIIDDETTLKKVYYYPEEQFLILRPENDKYKDMIYKGDELEHIHILGKAIAFQSNL